MCTFSQPKLLIQHFCVYKQPALATNFKCFFLAFYEKNLHPGTQIIQSSHHLWTMCYVLCAKSLQLCPTLCDPKDCSLPASSVHGILQKRILEWIAVHFSGGSFQPRDRTYILCLLHRQVGSLPLVLPGKPYGTWPLCKLVFIHICSYSLQKVCIVVHYIYK